MLLGEYSIGIEMILKKRLGCVFFGVMLTFILQLPAISQVYFNVEKVWEIKTGRVGSMVLKGDALFFSATGFMFAFDVTDIENPVFLDTLDWWRTNSDNDFCYGMVVKEGLLYGASTINGLMTVDVSTPSDLKLVRRTGISTNFPPIINLHEYNGFLYMVDLVTLQVFSLSQPESPQYISTQKIDPLIPDGSFPGNPLIFRHDSLWIPGGSGFDGALYLYRVNADGSLSHDTTFMDYQSELVVRDIKTKDSLVIIIGLNGQHVKIFRRSVALLPQYVLATINNLMGCSNIELRGDYIYLLCDSNARLLVYDISNPNQPVKVAEYYAPYTTLFRRMIVKGSYVLLGTQLGVEILKINLPTNGTAVPESPTSLSLAPAYPNPFSGSTTITYSLPVQQHISLDVYNALGMKVQSLYNGFRELGTHTARLDASAFPAGTYRVVLRSGEGVQTQMVVVR